MSKTVFCISFLSFFLFSTCFSQEVTMEKTIDYLNKKLQGKCKISLKSLATIEFLQENQVYREDKFHLQSLDPSLVIFIPEDNVVKLSCVADEEECFARWIYKNDIKRYYSRLNIPTEGLDEKSIQGIEKAFKHMIKLSLEPDYKLYEFFE
ncbi:MAG TPA: hypothetical protein DDX39_09085 [Bacteroidales bacterium]|nr:MAG: hypothetical protein A2W98_06110 [Bacteroidetes bacterium GWF2_33_38]HBF88782.1 hypothetical protein [Bacteroidales bacterium]